MSDRVSLESSRCEDETEALARGVIESLFSGMAITPLTPESEPTCALLSFFIVIFSSFAVLPHVLEVYDVPEYVLADDVVNALATTDFGSATVKWLERKMVFVVFESERQARDALVFHKHQWLRLRPLSKSPARVQEKALAIQVGDLHLRLHTNVGIARRMVESTLGMRSSVSMEQREVENKQLANAKAAKKNYVRWDD
uniref:RRM domain-containing protein n=1 Tax=Angiostrongylus cantonensis TaxID=6313 RepID=A0A0K0D647_ANGCA